METGLFFEGSNVPVTAALIQNPYKQFDVTVAAGAQITLDFDYNFCRVLTAAASTWRLRFGETGSFTDLVGGGIGYELPVVVRKITIQNVSGGSANISLGLAIGKIFDDRLNVSGTVTVQPVPVTAWNTGSATVDTSADLIVTANVDRESVTIQAGILDLYVAATNGVTTADFKIPANASHTFTHKLDIYGIRASSSATAYYSEQEN